MFHVFRTVILTTIVWAVQGYRDYESTSECNVTLIAETQPKVIVDPKALDANISNCWWRISSGDDGQRVVLDTLELGLVRRRDCNVARVKLYKGPEASGMTVRSWCGSYEKILQRSDTGFTLVADPRYYEIFLFKYYQENVVNNSVQRRAVRLTEGTLESPGYPVFSYGDFDQTYVITADQEGDVITIETESFSLNPRTGLGLSDDLVTISQGGETLGRYRRQTGPYIRVDSSRGPVTIRYQTYNQSNSRSINGFRLKYNALPPSTDPSVIGYGNVDVTGRFGFLPVPSYGTAKVRVNESLNFVWMLDGANDRYNIRVTILSSQPRMFCEDEYIIAYDGTADNERVPLQCSSRGPVFQGTKQNMTVIMPYSEKINYTGVRLRHFLTLDRYPCGRNLSATERFSQFATLAYPNPYDGNLNCVYNIQAPRGQRVFVTSTDGDVDIEDSMFCTKDAVLIQDVSSPSSDGEVRNIFCGRQPVSLTSVNSTMTVVFRTDSSGNGRGFRLHFRAVADNESCAKQVLNVIDRSLNIPVPDYRSNQINRECQYILTAPDGYVVYMEVNTSLARPDCTNGYVEAFDGANPLSSVSLRKWCGVNDTGAASSSGIFMSIIIKQSNTTNLANFRMTYSALQKPTVISGGSQGLSTGVIIGIVIGVIPVLVLIIVGIVFIVKRRASYSM